MASQTVANALKGNEICDYTRRASDKGRWAATWTVFSSNFLKIIITNLLTLVFFLPLAAAVFLRGMYVNTNFGLYPFSTNIGPTAVPALPNVAGMAEQITMTADLIFYSIAILCGLIAAVGVAGACYTLKKMVNTGGEYSVKDFFRGVKKSYFRVALPVLLFMVLFFCTVLVSDWKNMEIALGHSSGWPIAATVLMIILLVVVGIICLWLIAVGVSYKVGPLQTIKSSFSMLGHSVLQTIFMAGFSFIPVWLLLVGGIVQSIMLFVFIFIGFSFVFICWMSYTQWIFDMFVAPPIEESKPAAKKSAPAAAANVETDEKDLAREMLAAGRIEVLATPMAPIGKELAPALGKSYGRGDLERVALGRQEIEKKAADYRAAHKNDKRFAEYNAMFADREKALGDDGKKGKKKKKISADNLLR